MIRDAPFAFSASVLAVFVLIFFGLQWIHSAEIENLRSANTKLGATIQSLEAAIKILEIPRSTAQSPSRAAADNQRPLEHLTNLQLRTAAIAFAAQMRTFDANANAEFKMSPHNSSKQEMQRAWDAETRRSREAFRQEQLEFLNHYLGNARELQDEILFRLNTKGTFGPFGNLSERLGEQVLKTGDMNGPLPVVNAANYLEIIARKLPL